MKHLSLNRGLVALIDDDDYEYLSRWRWIMADGRVQRNGRKRDGETGTIRLHRVIMNAPKGKLVDHRNHNTLDNRRDNLRICTQAENLRNQALQTRPKTSQYKGVTLLHGLHRRDKWMAQIMVSQKHYYLGCYKSEIGAARAYDRAACKYFGEFANPNFLIKEKTQCVSVG